MRRFLKALVPSVGFLTLPQPFWKGPALAAPGSTMSTRAVEVRLASGALVTSTEVESTGELLHRTAEALKKPKSLVRLSFGGEVQAADAPLPAAAGDMPLALQAVIVQPLDPDDLVATVKALEQKGVTFELGLTDEEVQAIETYFGIRFPPDLRAFYQHKLPASHSFKNYRAMLAAGHDPDLTGPFLEDILFDVEENDVWIDAWGEKPEGAEECVKVAKQKLAENPPPRLIPIFSHRCMASEPHEVGQPVLSIHQTDIIVYGPDLLSYLAAEFDFEPVKPVKEEPELTIPFWSDFR